MSDLSAFADKVDEIAAEARELSLHMVRIGAGYDPPHFVVACLMAAVAVASETGLDEAGLQLIMGTLYEKARRYDSAKGRAP